MFGAEDGNCTAVALTQPALAPGSPEAAITVHHCPTIELTMLVVVREIEIMCLETGEVAPLLGAGRSDSDRRLGRRDAGITQRVAAMSLIVERLGIVSLRAEHVGWSIGGSCDGGSEAALLGLP